MKYLLPQAKKCGGNVKSVVIHGKRLSLTEQKVPVAQNVILKMLVPFVNKLCFIM